MTVIPLRAPKSPDDFPNWRFETLDIAHHAPTRSIWMNYRADAPDCYTLLMLVELLQLRDSLRAFYEAGRTGEWPFRYLVMASKKDGVFSLGGDLESFSAAIRRQDRETLVAYAHACVDLVYSYSRSIDLPIVTLSAVHGQCLGGAMEAALAFDFIIAEEDAVFGLPEVMFNTFPGMGAITMLTRRVGAALTQQIVMEGRTYSGQEMYDLAVIDGLAKPRSVRNAALDWMANADEDRWMRRRVIAEARRKCQPVTHDELISITDLWADTSCRIDARDLRHMERLARAQRRLVEARCASAAAPRGRPASPRLSKARDV